MRPRTVRHIENYEFPCAERLWVVARYEITQLPHGEAVSMVEFERIHRDIANQICGTAGPLSASEFEFLCDVAQVPYAHVARRIGLDRSAITKWLNSGRSWKPGRSNLIKQWLLIHLFGENLVGHTVAAELLGDSKALLAHLRDEIIARGAAANIDESTGSSK